MNKKLTGFGIVSALLIGWSMPGLASDYLTECESLKSISKKGQGPCYFIKLNDALLSQFQPPQPPGALMKKRREFSLEGGAGGGKTNILPTEKTGTSQTPVWGGGDSWGGSDSSGGGTWGG